MSGWSTGPISYIYRPSVSRASSDQTDPFVEIRSSLYSLGVLNAGILTKMKYQHRVVGLLSLLAIITYLDRVCIAVAGPRMQDSLHISPQAWGWVTSLFFISYAAFEIPSGALGDRIGPRRVLTRIVTWWSAFTSRQSAPATST
jgi:MFS family permease